MPENSTTTTRLWLEGWHRHWGWLTVLTVLGLTAAIRLRLLDLPLERDEGEYAYAGQLLLQGIPPYQIAYNMKFPGTYAAYAVIMSLFGQTPAGIHLGVTIVTTLTSLLLYWFGRRCRDEVVGAVAATTFAVLALSDRLVGLAGHATHFAALFATAGLGLAWSARQTASRLRAGLSGLMFGLAVLMKQHALFFCLWAGLLFLMPGEGRAGDAKGRWRSLAAAGAGMALPLALTAGWLWSAGVLERFWFWTIQYAREYVTDVPWQQAPRVFWDQIKIVIGSGPLVWLLAGIGLFWLWFDRGLRQVRWPVGGFVVAALLTTGPGFYFRDHYFLLFLPAVGMLAGVAVSGAGRRGWPRVKNVPAAAWPVGLYLCALTATVVDHRWLWFEATPMQAAREIYPANPFIETVAVAHFIRTNSPPDARVAVLGSEPQVYFLSRRLSATGYIYMYPLMTPQPFAGRMQAEMIREIESARPEYVVVVKFPHSWLARTNSITLLLDWWFQSYQTNYARLEFADLGSAAAGLALYRRRTP